METKDEVVIIEEVDQSLIREKETKRLWIEED